MRTATVLSLLAMAGLVGCGTSSEDELRQWMNEQNALTRPNVKPISEPKQFKPELYALASVVDPFSSQKLTQALKRDSAQAVSNGALVAPELVRRKEALEAFPLDAMALVGNMAKEGKPVALVKVDNLLHQVRLGNYLGQNYGRVMRITETEVILREIVQDAAGEWIERTATLQLQERTK
jgi:type IV pilus assembly protein PilP